MGLRYRDYGDGGWNRGRKLDAGFSMLDAGSSPDALFDSRFSILDAGSGDLGIRDWVIGISGTFSKLGLQIRYRVSSTGYPAFAEASTFAKATADRQDDSGGDSGFVRRYRANLF